MPSGRECAHELHDLHGSSPDNSKILITKDQNIHGLRVAL